MVRNRMTAGCGAAVVLCAAMSYGVPSTPAVLSVVDSVVTANVEPLGANVGKVMGGTNYCTNQFMRGTGFEPAYDRWLRRVDRCGTNWFEWDGFGGISEWELDSTGFGNGAAVRIYRIVNSSGQPLAWATGGAMWHWHVVLEGFLGVQPELEGLRLDPCFPSEWREARVLRRWRGGEYDIRIHNPDGAQKGVKAVLLDGQPLRGNLLPVPQEKGERHKVEVVMG